MKTTKQGSTTFQSWNFDTRVLQRNMADGVITQNDVKGFLDGLTDVAAKSETMHTNRPGQSDGDLDDEDDVDSEDADDVDA